MEITISFFVGAICAYLVPAPTTGYKTSFKVNILLFQSDGSLLVELGNLYFPLSKSSGRGQLFRTLGPNTEGSVKYSKHTSLTLCWGKVLALLRADGIALDTVT